MTYEGLAPKHSEEKTEKIPVNNGQNTYSRKMKYCQKHGWIDLFAIGGELVWHRQHSNCDKQVETGAQFSEEKFFKQAA